jgi:ATP-binding protein involved in chromosome partitioning
MADYKDIISGIENPATEKTLGSENRVQSVETKDGELYVVYNRDGIDMATKREIEKKIIQAVSMDFSAFKVNVKTVSSQTQEVKVSDKPNSSNEEKGSTGAKGDSQAQLKVGHGKIGQKKPIPGVKKVIAVASGKGGVGKSTFTANLALALSGHGAKVGVIDADIYGPSQPKIFGVEDQKPRANDNKKMIPIQSNGISLMSFGFFIEPDAPVIWRGPMLGGVLNQFLFDVEWGELDIMIIDLPPGTGDMQLSMIQSVEVDGSVVLTTPQDVSTLDARKGLMMFKKVEVPVLGVVENMSKFICNAGVEYNIFGKGGGEKLAGQCSVDYLGDIPLEIALRESSDKGEPYMSDKSYADLPAYKSYAEVSQKILEKLDLVDLPKKSQGFFGKLFSRK